MLAVLVLALPFGCSEKDSPTEATDNLCPGQDGVGVRVTGRAKRVDICVLDDVVVGSVDSGVWTVFTTQGRYDVSARMVASDGTTFEIQMLFPHKTDLPKKLNLTGNQAQAIDDPDGAWIYYREIPDGGDAVESVSVSGGTFTLSFSDQSVTTGTFADIGLALENTGTGEPAGSRTITEGFFSISTDS